MSVVILILLFFTDLLLTKSFTLLKNLVTTYKNIFLSFIFIIFSISCSNALGIHAEKAWYLEFVFIVRYGLIFFILLYSYSKGYISQELLLYMILISLTLQSIDGLYQHFFGVDFLRGHQVIDGSWLTGAVFYYNPFGMLMAIGAGITISLLVEYKKFKITTAQILLLFSLLSIFIYDLLYSLSRASWISFAVFVILMTIFNYKKLNMRTIFALCLLLLFTIIFIAYDHNILARFNQLLQGDSSNRYEIWSHSISAFLERPLLGYGLNSFKTVISQEYSATHNSILEILLYLGLLGFIAFSNMLILVLREILLTKNFINLSFFVSLLILSQFDASVTNSKIFLSILTIFAFFIFAHKIEKIQQM